METALRSSPPVTLLWKEEECRLESGLCSPPVQLTGSHRGLGVRPRLTLGFRVLRAANLVSDFCTMIKMKNVVLWQKRRTITNERATIVIVMMMVVVVASMQTAPAEQEKEKWFRRLGRDKERERERERETFFDFAFAEPSPGPMRGTGDTPCETTRLS